MKHQKEAPKNKHQKTNKSKAPRPNDLNVSVIRIAGGACSLVLVSAPENRPASPSSTLPPPAEDRAVVVRIEQRSRRDGAAEARRSSWGIGWSRSAMFKNRRKGTAMPAEKRTRAVGSPCLGKGKDAGFTNLAVPAGPKPRLRVVSCRRGRNRSRDQRLTGRAQNEAVEPKSFMGHRVKMHVLWVSPPISGSGT